MALNLTVRILQRQRRWQSQFVRQSIVHSGRPPHVVRTMRIETLQKYELPGLLQLVIQAPFFKPEPQF